MSDPHLLSDDVSMNVEVATIYQIPFTWSSVVDLILTYI